MEYYNTNRVSEALEKLKEEIRGLRGDIREGFGKIGEKVNCGGRIEERFRGSGRTKDVNKDIVNSTLEHHDNLFKGINRTLEYHDILYTILKMDFLNIAYSLNLIDSKLAKDE